MARETWLRPAIWLLVSISCTSLAAAGLVYAVDTGHAGWSAICGIGVGSHGTMAHIWAEHLRDEVKRA